MTLIVIFGLWFVLAILISKNRPSVRRFAFKRFIWVPILFIPIWFGTYSMMKAAPGDPAYVIAGSHASEEVIEATREAYGLNRPHIVQFVDDTWKQANGNSGNSFIFSEKTIAQLAAERIPYSFAITFPSLLVILFVGLTVGLWATFKKGTWLDTFLLSSALFWQAFPSLILIQFLMLIFSVKLGWLPAGWSGDWTAVFTTTAIIPIVTMSLGGIAGMARFVRTITLNVIDEPYINAAKSRGLGPFRIAIRYVLHNASLPLVTVLLPMFFLSFEGSFFIERIYSIPGFSNFALEALFARDYPFLLFFAFWGILLGLFIKWLTDMLYIRLDPRATQ